MILRNIFCIGIKQRTSQVHLFKSFATECLKPKIDKTLLTKFKKKTGYSFAKCNDALKKFNNNVDEAEIWLHEQAEKEGWSKAAKLQSRTTNQGLVGVLKRDNFAALVEVSCETDFVARNDLFRQLVTTTAESTLKFRENVILQNQKINSSTNTEITHLREMLLAHELTNLTVTNSDTLLQEYLVSIVGKLGENIKLKRALALATNSNNIIGTACHGNSSGIFEDCLMGTFASFVVLKPLQPVIDVNKHADLIKLANGLSQHVIGMNPKAINATEADIETEDVLVHQEYLLNDKLKVSELVENAHCEIVDFVRYSINE